MAKTYMLIGNPEKGMNGVRWEDDHRHSLQRWGGFVQTEWHVISGSKPGEQVVLLHLGKMGVPGIIGFGQRCDGATTVHGNGRNEYPVRFANVRSLYEEPFIRLSMMIERGACRMQANSVRHAYYSSLTEITHELPALEELCQQELGLPLSTWCSQPLAERLMPEAATSLAASRCYVEDRETLRYLELQADLSTTVRQELIDSRRGQGLFRGRILLAEPFCRVTGVSAPQHLRASHIKPWKDSNDFERLDRNNGLMLSPHVDHLFDQGYMTFDPDGRMLLTTDVPADVVSRWQLQQVVPPRAFSKQQASYLSYHRSNCFHG